MRVKQTDNDIAILPVTYLPLFISDFSYAIFKTASILEIMFDLKFRSCSTVMDTPTIVSLNIFVIIEGGSCDLIDNLSWLTTRDMFRRFKY